MGEWGNGEMTLSKYDKSRIAGGIAMAIFIVAGIYLAVFYYLEYPNPALHWEAIAPLLACLGYMLFS